MADPTFSATVLLLRLSVRMVVGSGSAMPNPARAMLPRRAISLYLRESSKP